jgi:regulator of sirC expression with transglutaminase-like and TPR domain
MDVDAALTLLSREPTAQLDVAELALCLARDEYPSLDVEGYLAEIDAMAREVRQAAPGGVEAALAALCRYLFHDLGFRGNDTAYYDPRNSYLNEVLDRRLGIPITLSVVAIAVGRRSGMQVEGIGLPGHFIGKVVGQGRQLLFDPFHGGRPLSEEQCEALVERATGAAFHVSPEALEAIALGPLIQRILANLKGAYLREGDFRRVVRVIERLQQLDPSDVQLHRDLGAALLQSGRAGRAIDHLIVYLDRAPDAADADLVRQVLQQARTAVAKLN